MSDDSLMKEGLLKATESATFLSVSRSTVYKLMDTGELPYVKILGCRRISKKALNDYLEANSYQVGRSDDLVEINRNRPKKLRK